MEESLLANIVVPSHKHTEWCIYDGPFSPSYEKNMVLAFPNTELLSDMPPDVVGN
jgi:hypothetical protein